MTMWRVSFSEPCRLSRRFSRRHEANGFCRPKAVLGGANSAIVHHAAPEGRSGISLGRSGISLGRSGISLREFLFLTAGGVLPSRLPWSKPNDRSEPVQHPKNHTTIGHGDERGDKIVGFWCRWPVLRESVEDRVHPRWRQAKIIEQLPAFCGRGISRRWLSSYGSCRSPFGRHRVYREPSIAPSRLCARLLKGGAEVVASGRHRTVSRTRQWNGMTCGSGRSCEN